MLLPMGLAFLVGACSPFYPKPHPNNPQPPATPNPQALTPEQQQLLNQSNAGVDAQGNPILNPTTMGSVTPAPVPPNTAPGKKNYPTAAPVPGKEGFVFNPYTHNIVDVKGIASGKLCRDPEDADETHKFRVP